MITRIYGHAIEGTPEEMIEIARLLYAREETKAIPDPDPVRGGYRARAKDPRPVENAEDAENQTAEKTDRLGKGESTPGGRLELQEDR